MKRTLLLLLLAGCMDPGFKPQDPTVEPSGFTGAQTPDGKDYTTASGDGAVDELKEKTTPEQQKIALTGSARIEIKKERWSLRVPITGSALEFSTSLPVKKNFKLKSGKATAEIDCVSTDCNEAVVKLNVSQASSDVAIIVRSRKAYIQLLSPGEKLSSKLKPVFDVLQRENESAVLHTTEVPWGASHFRLDFSNNALLGQLVAIDNGKEEIELVGEQFQTIKGALIGNSYKGELLLKLADASNEIFLQVLTSKPTTPEVPTQPAPITPPPQTPPVAPPAPEPTTPPPAPEPTTPPPAVEPPAPPVAPPPAPPILPSPVAPPTPPPVPATYRGLLKDLFAQKQFFPSIGEAKIYERIIESSTYAQPQILAAKYAGRGRTSAQHFMQSVQANMNVLWRAFAQNDLPIEFSLVTYIESQFFAKLGYPIEKNPKSTAYGPFQFMVKTARWLDLEVSPKCDERASLSQSTQAAAQYFRFMIDKHFSNDPLLAVLGFNWGQGAVENAIKFHDNCNGDPNRCPRLSTEQLERLDDIQKSQIDFWTVDKFNMSPNSIYVKKFLAVVALTQAPEKFGLKLPDPSENKIAPFTEPACTTNPEWIAGLDQPYFQEASE